jgi:ATP-dependent helicase/nuclease subunit B
MAPQLFLTPTIHTALRHLIFQIGEAKKADSLSPIVILVPTAGVIHDLRRKLGDTMGVQMYQFYRLGHAVLDEAGIPIHEINDAAIRRLIRGILAELNSKNLLTTFASVWEKPGFVEVLLGWAREMKSQGVSPEQYAEYAGQSGNERDRQLADFYTSYQRFMQQHAYSDADGLLWLTAEALEKDPLLFHRLGPLFVLGFDQFTPVQIRILQQLGIRYADLNIYLLWDENRSENSLALARLRQTRKSLMQGLPFQVHLLAEQERAGPALAHLHDAIFEAQDRLVAVDQAIRLIAAPSREAEIRRTILEVKRLLLADVSPAEIAVLAPNPKVYRSLIHTVAAEYGVPIEVDLPLIDNPAIAAFARLLSLGPDFPWRDTLDILRSPYICQTWLSSEQIGLLDRLSRERPVIAGRDQWSFALQPLATGDPDTEDEDWGSLSLVAKLSPETLAALEAGLAAFFDHLTPALTALYRDYTWWIQTALIGLFPEHETPEDEIAADASTLDLLGCCSKSPFPKRDLQALGMAATALRRLLSAADTAPGEKVVPWETYRAELIDLIRVMQIPPDPFQSQVRFGRLEEGRAREVDHLFVLGLSEGEFPTPPPADVLFAPLERELHPLPLIRYTPADDASLWWQVLGNVRQRLTLMRPYIDDNGAPWQPSPYWDAVQESFSKLEIETIPIADHPSQENAASANELLVALAQSEVQQIPDPLADLWAYTVHANHVMQHRQSYQPPGEYEGILQTPVLRDELARRFDPAHVWSASRLNRYSHCPYGFFAEQILELEAQNDPEAGFDVMQRGSILHAVLEHLYQRLIDIELAVTTTNLENILECLEESSKTVFQNASHRSGFRPSALWIYEQEELRRMLRVLVTWECEQNGESASYSPYLLEAGFGFYKSGFPPLEINVDETHFRLHGLIDRLDRDADGNLRVLDYKSGGTKYSASDLEKGLALQTALYALAAEHFWTQRGARVAESHYWHIPTREASGSIRFQGAVRDNALAESAIRQAALSIERIRDGVFPGAPGKPAAGGMLCRSNCDFAPICRVTRQSIRKARQGGFA